MVLNFTTQMKDLWSTYPYVCTLTQGCFQDVTDTKMNDSEIRSLTEVRILNTTTQFSFQDEVVSYINTKMEELHQRP